MMQIGPALGGARNLATRAGAFVKVPANIVKMSSFERAELARLAKQTSAYTAKIRKAFFAAIDKLRGQIDERVLVQLLQSNQPQRALDYVNGALRQAGYKPIASAVTQATLAAGVASAEAADVPTEIAFTFGHMNPATVAKLQQNEFRLITNLTDTTRQQVAQVIRAGVSAGRNPLDVARDVREHIGLTPRQSQAVINYRTALENGDSSALDRALRDARFDSTVQSAVDGESELSQAQIDRMVERYEARMLKYRAETIARTEATRATNEGNIEPWRQAVADGVLSVDQVTRRWLYTHDGRTRLAHILIPSMNPDGVGLYEPFQTPDGPLMYPGDPFGPPEATINCRCATFLKFKPK